MVQVRSVEFLIRKVIRDENESIRGPIEAPCDPVKFHCTAVGVEANSFELAVKYSSSS